MKEISSGVHTTIVLKVNFKGHVMWMFVRRAQTGYNIGTGTGLEPVPSQTGTVGSGSSQEPGRNRFGYKNWKTLPCGTG